MPSDVDEEQLELFMAAIRDKESGSRAGNYAARNDKSGAYGAYQIMPQYWDGWATEAGIPGADHRDKGAQDYVARYKFKQYYRKYRDWGLVAVAWFAGGSRADAAMKAGSIAGIANISDGYTKVQQYYDDINAAMGELPPYDPGAEDEFYTPQKLPDRPDELRTNLVGMLDTMSNAIAGGSRMEVGSTMESATGFADQGPAVDSSGGGQILLEDEDGLI